MQVFLNGHDWLARKLDATGISYTQCDNVFVWIEDVKRAQRFCDRMSSTWPHYSLGTGGNKTTSHGNGGASGLR